MDKTFDLKSCDFLDPADFRKTQFPGGNHTTGPLFLQKSRPVFSGNSHLGAAVKFHPREMLPKIRKHAHILYDSTIQSGLVIRQ